MVDTSPSLRKTIDDLKSQSYRLKDSKDFAGALKVRKKLQEVYVESGASPDDQSANLNYMAYLGVCAGDLDEAESAARLSLELYLTASNQSDELLATYHMMLASTLAERGSFTEAVICGEKALTLFAQSPFHPTGDTFLERCKLDVERMRKQNTQPYIEP